MKVTIRFCISFWSLFILVGCKQQQNVKAVIFERKEVEGDRLMIKYKYSGKERSFIDSVTIQNRVIESDTIDLTIDPSDPEKAVPHLQ